jgi:putative peptidoglycan lipid II flippase
LSDAPPRPGVPGGEPERTSRGALAVGGGILISRVAGLVRAAATSAAFGVGPYADVFQTALRTPNLLQNLLGEQALSASFIPVYSRMLAHGDREGARRFVGASFGLLAVVASALALLGIVAARPFVGLISTGYVFDAQAVANGTATVDRFELAVRAVRWIFPMTAVLVLSAWALGVLNSHRRFFLSYFAPVFWNASIVAALGWVAWGAAHGRAVDGQTFLFAACIGALVGGFAQFLVQLPGAVRAAGGLRPELSFRVPGVRPALIALGPAIAGRGVVQLSSYVDLFLASFLAAGAPGALNYAQMIYLLPISLFGQSTAAAALPELSSVVVAAPIEDLARRTRRLLARIDFFIVPAAVALIGFGWVAVAGLYRLFPGRFGADDVVLVAILLGAYALGLHASTGSRLLQTTFFALGDTATPARIAAGRMIVSATVAVPTMFALDRVTLADLPWLGAHAGARPIGALGLALAASVGAWFERIRLGRVLSRRLPGHAPGLHLVAGRLAAAGLGALPAIGALPLLAGVHPTLRALGVFALFGAGYLGAALALRLPDRPAIPWVDRRRP